MFNVLATMSPTMRPPTIHRPLDLNLWRQSEPRLLPVARALRSHISWTVAISGSVSSAVHTRPRPNWAPAWE